MHTDNYFTAIIQVNMNESAGTPVAFCLHALDDSNYCIWIKEKTLEFPSMLLSMLSLGSGQF